MSTPEARREILLTEMQELEGYLSGLPAEAWEQPSACELWTVADVVAHLTLNLNNYSARVLRALQGDASSDETSSRPGRSGVDPRATEERAVAFRKELGDQLFAEFFRSTQAMNQAFLGAGPGDWDNLVYRPAFPESIGSIVDVFIAEVAVHGWDIRSRFEPEAGLPAQCVPIIVERIPGRPRWWSFSLEPGFSPLPLRCRFEITMPQQYQVDTVVTEDRQYLEVDSKEPAQVTFRCDGETFVMVMYGRIKLQETIASGQISIDGDEKLAAEFVQRFTGG